MKNDANNVLVDQDGLYGDGPGAAVVTIEVDGRRLQLPRSTFIGILTSASNRAGEKMDEPEAVYGRAQAALQAAGQQVSMKAENAIENYRYWKAMEEHCRAIHDFARSTK